MNSARSASSPIRFRTKRRPPRVSTISGAAPSLACHHVVVSVRVVADQRRVDDGDPPHRFANHRERPRLVGCPHRASRAAVSLIAVTDHSSALAPPAWSPVRSLFHTFRQTAPQKRSCSRRGMYSVPHSSQARVSLTASCYAGNLYGGWPRPGFGTGSASTPVRRWASRPHYRALPLRAARTAHRTISVEVEPVYPEQAIRFSHTDWPGGPCSGSPAATRALPADDCHGPVGCRGRCGPPSQSGTSSSAGHVCAVPFRTAATSSQ